MPHRPRTYRCAVEPKTGRNSTKTSGVSTRDLLAMSIPRPPKFFLLSVIVVWHEINQNLIDKSTVLVHVGKWMHSFISEGTLHLYETAKLFAYDIYGWHLGAFSITDQRRWSPVVVHSLLEGGYSKIINAFHKGGMQISFIHTGAHGPAL